MCQMCELNFLGFAEPQELMLDGFRDALARGWSPSTDPHHAAAIRAAFERDPAAYLASVRDDAPPSTFKLADGRVVDKLPMRMRWIWDGDFCGMINLRWQPGTSALPDHVLGHIGYGVVPWKRGHGIAKKALRHMLFEAREVGLVRVEVCTTVDNVASQRVIVANGGRSPEPFRHAESPTVDRLRYRIDV
jgi:predicted acetyltransferase